MTAPLRKKRHEMPDPEKVQLLASDAGASRWVAASAGSGKTTVLVRRVLRLLLAGVKPKKVLCLTFTKAAAAEMANRVTKALSDWAVCSDDELRAGLDKLQNKAPTKDQLATARRLFARTLSCPGGMRIRTIHAFCQEVLRRFPIEAGLPPHFAVIEEIETRALAEDVQDGVLHAASNDPESEIGKALRPLVRDLGERGFGDAMQTMLRDRARLDAAVVAAGSLSKLIDKMRVLFDLAPDDTEEKFISDAVRSIVLPDMKVAAKTLLRGTSTYVERGQEMLNWLELPIDSRIARFDEWCDCFFTVKSGVYNFYKNYADKKLLEANPNLDELLRREAARLQSTLERCEAARMAESTAAVLTLGRELTRKFEERKRAQAVLDYDDLVIRANELLHRGGIAPWVLYKLDGGLDHILVDEAQDTSRAQWRIISALAEEFFSGSGSRPDENRTLFVVGDEKQSIFSFQHADPDAFDEMRAFFKQRIEDADKPFKEVPLHMSFRSAPAILKAVDAVFASEHARSGVSSETVEHYAAKEGKFGRVEVWPLLPAPEKDTHGSEWVLPLGYEPERDPQTELAGLIAKKIKSWIDAKGKLPGHDEPIAPGDIIILLRRRGRFADLMVRALKQVGVAVTGVDRMKLVKQLPVMDLLALMQFALLPEDDLNLATVLRGPLLGLSEDELMELAIGRKGTLWASLNANEKFAAARDYLQRWLREADFATPFTMLARMLNEACPGSVIGGREALWKRLGPDALDPIDELLNAAQQFGRNHTSSLQGFLHWLTATEAEIKRELDQGGGQVRIMTVHAAKGLEAPIVFLPDTANVPRSVDVPKLQWNTSGVPVYLARRPQSGAARGLWDEARRKQMEEYRRLFYVALTRAEKRLYIGGWEPSRNEGESATESWYALARNALLSEHQPEVLGKDEPQPDIAFADPVIAASKQKTKPRAVVTIAPMPLPKWAREKAIVEYVPQKAPSPSQLAPETEPPVASPDILYARGRIIHRLLQSLPDMDDVKRDAAAARFLANPQHHLKKAEQDEIKNEVLRLLRKPDYAPLFAPDSRAEVPLAGIIGGLPASRQIDRLCVREDAVWIIDYKSNRPPPSKVEDIAPGYRKQLAEYRQLLAEIYPDKPIKCFLLWTYSPSLMPIPDRMLDT